MNVDILIIIHMNIENYISYYLLSIPYWLLSIPLVLVIECISLLFPCGVAIAYAWSAECSMHAELA